MKLFFSLCLLMSILCLPAQRVYAATGELTLGSAVYTGFIENGSANGFGTLEFDGGVYMGMFRNNIFHGLGISFFNGHPEGLLQASGTHVYGRLDGEAYYLLNSSHLTRASVLWVNGGETSVTVDGPGNEYGQAEFNLTGSVIYRGEVLLNTQTPHGYGVIIDLENNNFHIGTFRNGLIDGTGIQVNGSDGYFEGIWRGGSLFIITGSTGIDADLSSAILWPSLARASTEPKPPQMPDILRAMLTPLIFTYEQEGDGAVITGYTGSSPAVTIPAEINGIPVTGIGENAFSGNTLITSVTIPHGVTDIGAGAFNGCRNLSEASVPESVTRIGNNAFRGAGLVSLTIPGGIVNFGSNVFMNNTSLTSVVISPGATAIGAGAFRGCRLLESVSVPESVTSIGNQAFLGCTALTEIILPGGLASIGRDAFSGSGITSVNIPESITSIGAGAFSETPWLDGFTDEFVIAGNILIKHNSGSGSATVPYGVVSVAAGAFGENIMEIILPESMTAIGASMFQNYGSLTSVTIPASVATIGNNAFLNCAALESVTIPASVRRIGNGAFSGCTSLSAVYFEGAPPTVGNNAFLNTADGLTFYFRPQAAGWTFPVWNGFNTEPFN
jgi:hypothetical protein